MLGVGKKILTLIGITILVHSTLLVMISPVSAAETSEWSKPRPSKHRDFCDIIGNVTGDGISSIGIGAEIFTYHESPSPNDNDFLRFRVSTSANSRGWIDYNWDYQYSYSWIEATKPTNITGDNDGIWLELLDILLFYGVEYDKIWVCSNGFLCLNKTCTSPLPQNIPSDQEPNPIIAVFWRDLHPENGGSITYEENVDFNGGKYFVVSWNNVPDAEGNPQSFQVLILNREGFFATDYHNRICFQYKNITKNCVTTIGIEDQLGNRGKSLDLNDIQNELCRVLYIQNMGYRLSQLTLRLTKNDTSAMIDFLPNYVGGYNVILKNNENPYGDAFAGVIGFVADLFIAYYVEGVKTAIMLTGLVITGQTAFELSNELSPPEFVVHNAPEQDNEAYIISQCVVENLSLPYCKPFDSSLAATVEWSFLDPNDMNHDLTITAEAMYASLDKVDVRYVSTSVTLNMYTGDHYLDSDTCVIGGSEITGVKVWVDGNIYYSPTTVIVTHGIHTVQVESSFIIDEYLFTFVRWHDQIEDNPRTIYLDIDKSFTAYYNVTYIGTCPTLFVWNGSEYVYEALLDIHAPSDVTLQHQIQQTLVKDGLFYKLQLRELDNFTSHIDQVKLYAVDYSGEWHLCLLTSAIHRQKGWVTPLLTFDDSIRVDLAPTETIDLKFIYFGDAIDRFIFEINGYNKKWPG